MFIIFLRLLFLKEFYKEHSSISFFHDTNFKKIVLNEIESDEANSVKISDNGYAAFNDIPNLSKAILIFLCLFVFCSGLHSLLCFQ